MHQLSRLFTASKSLLDETEIYNNNKKMEIDVKWVFAKLRLMGFILLFLLITSDNLVVSAAELKIPEGPIKIKFDVRPGCPELTQQQVLVYYYGIYNIAAVMRKQLKHEFKDTYPIVLRFICDEAIFKQYQDQRFGHHNFAGYYNFRKDYHEMVLHWKDPKDNMNIGVFHEAAHLLVSMRKGTDRFSRLPFWFNEGLAGYFGNAVPSRDSLKVLISWRNQNVEKWVKNKSFPTFELFFKLKPEQLSKWQFSREMGESLIHYLMETPRGQQIIGNLLKGSFENQDLAKLLAKQYPGGIPRLQQDWEKWLQTPRHVHNWRKLR